MFNFMSQSNVDDEKRRRRKHRSSKSHVSTTHRHRRTEGENEDTLESPAAERPANLDELRNARLASLDSRQKSASHGRARSVPVTATLSPSASRPVEATKLAAEPIVREVRRKKKRKSHRPVESEKARESDEEDGGYVYARPLTSNPPQAPVPPPTERNNASHVRRSLPVRSRSSPDVTKRTTARRSSPSIVRRGSAATTNYKSVLPLFLSTGTRPTDQSRTPSTVSRPSIRRNSTTPASQRPATKRSSTTPQIIEEPSAPEVIDTEPKAKVEPKKNQRVVGKIFAPKPMPKASCLTCGDEVSTLKIVKLPCKHKMCHDCLRRVFKLAVKDPAHMPPKCCTDEPINLQQVDSLFDSSFRKIFNRKVKEYKARNRIYCIKKGCGEWIQEKHMKKKERGKIGSCPLCKTQVCGICGQKPHKSKECPKDPAVQEFAEIAEKEGWRKCYSCSAMVELKEGCNHMTCRCTAEFCMVCGLKWKSCDCPWFSYEQVDPNADPVRYQQEMDRRREQELHDEEFARQVDAEAANQAAGQGQGFFNFGNARVHHLVNDQFVQQARQVLVGPYQGADQAARGLFGAFFAGRGATAPVNVAVNEHEEVTPTLEADTAAERRQRRPIHRRHHGADYIQQVEATRDGVPVIRHTPAQGWLDSQQDVFENRAETEAEREQAQRMRAWADGTLTD